MEHIEKLLIARGAAKAFEIEKELKDYCDSMRGVEARINAAHEAVVALADETPGYVQLKTSRRKEENYLDGCTAALSELLVGADKVCVAPQNKMFQASDSARDMTISMFLPEGCVGWT